jgi:hypothetical protein
MSLVLESKVGGDFKPHPEGIHPAVCVDVIDLGLVESEWQGQRRMVHKVRLVFESEQKTEEGKNCIVTKTFTASLHPKAKLAEFLGKWRGRPVVPGESIDLAKLIGANCTLVISHQQNMVGRTYASIDAVSKPTKRLAASGWYDPALARQRIAEWRAQSARNPNTGVRNENPNQNGQRVGSGPEQAFGGQGGLPKSGAGAPQSKAPEGAEDFDPEVGF